MSFNPYASEDFNRIQTKSKKSREEQKAEREAAKQQVDHPLMEGKKMDMSEQELKNFSKAMDKTDFRDMLGDYVDEISDPKHKPEMQQYLRQMEEQGDLPPGTKLIQPKTGYCIKTTVKKLASERTKSYFDQKCFINICFHESVEKAAKEPCLRPDGSRGFNWRLPYRVSKLRHDQDASKAMVSTYDVVFHEEVQSYLVYPEFQKFVSDTALDGIQRVLANDQEKVSTDYKIMKNLVCKGGEPSLMTVKEEQDNPLLANMDIEQHKTKMEKEIAAKKKAKMDEEEKEKENARRLKEASERFDHGEADEASSEEEDEQRPTGIIQPKYKIVHSFPVDMGDSWGGFKTAKMEHEDMLKAKVPTHLTVTIHLKWADSMKGANLDINETTLLFEYPEIYYLDLNLKYKTDPDQGNAKFDKSTKKLVIRLPIVGLTEDSQKVMDDHYKTFVTDKKETMSKLQLQGEVQDDNEQTTNDSERGTPEENELREQAMAKLSQMQSSGGLSSGRDFGEMNGGPIDDKYNLEQNTDEIIKKMLANKDEDDTPQDGFLKVYDENKNEQKLDDAGKPLTKDQVKFREEHEEQDLGL